MSAGEGAWECGTAGQGGVTVAFVEDQAAVVGTGDHIRLVIAVEVPIEVMLEMFDQPVASVTGAAKPPLIPLCSSK